MPVIAIPRMLLSLLSLILLGAGLYLLWTWYQGYDITDRHGVLHHDREAWRLYAGLGLFAWSFLGRFVVLMFIPAGQDEPREERGEASVVMAPDGAALDVESFGEAGRPTLVLTHGWGLNSTAWWYAKHALAGRYRLITWDLPGLGRSKLAKDGKITIDRFAEALGAVVEWTGSDRVVLVGHSIGGMMTQTLWRACPQSVLDRVAGVVLVNTTPRGSPAHHVAESRLARAALAADRAAVLVDHRPVAPGLAVELAELPQRGQSAGHAADRLWPPRHPRPS
jgi:predicted alpha/beta hydrolase family esterase